MLALASQAPSAYLASLAVALMALILLAAEADAARNVPAHEEYEPPTPSPFDTARNLFLGARVTGSPHWSDRRPEFAVDGRHHNPGDHWAAENIPVWLTVQLSQPQELNAIRLWTYWGDGRYYQYYIEGSLDGERWQMLADNRSNTRPATAAGESFFFPTTRVRFVRVTFTHNSRSNKAGGHIVEIEGYRLLDAAVQELRRREQAWAACAAGLHAGVGSVDTRYPRDDPPQVDEVRQCQLAAWRGERVAAQFVLWTADGAQQVRARVTPLRSEDGAELPADAVHVNFVRYVLADGHLAADVLDTAERLDIPPRSVRPIWVSVEPPGDAKPGLYRGQIEILAAGMPEPIVFELAVDVLPAAIPAPAEWKFWLDLWQNPYAVARYHRVEPWSPEHLSLLEKHLKVLAAAGQKCVTTTIVYQPWGTQTYDPYDSMVQWTKRLDGTWRFDYSAFDTYVELAMRCGITAAINCYSMVPWTNRYRYLDEATGDYVFVHAAPGSDEYEKLWRAFLPDFVEHLRSRGWLGKTAIAMDERPEELMRPMLALLREVAPELKVALAGGNEPRLKDDIDDWCVFINPPLDPAIARERAAKGKPTTFYVCCGPDRPNTFTFSPPAEAEWLGIYAAAQGYSGFLRWAYDSWVRDPLYDTSYVTWPAGDCFLVYPGPRSSIRFERLRQGIQDYEKIRLAREALQGRNDGAGREALQRLDQALAEFTYHQVRRHGAAEPVAKVRALLAEIGRLMSG